MIDDLPTWLRPAWDALAARPAVQGLLLAIVGLTTVRLVAARAQARLQDLGHAHQALVARIVVLYIGSALVLLGVANHIGLDLTALMATAGVATVAVGFAAQTSLSNLIAGLFLLIDRPFEIGDTVELEGRMGIVQEITLLSTLVRTFDGVLVRWPNEVVLKSTILNITRYAARRVDLPLRLPYGSDIPRARQVVRDAITELSLVLVEPAPEVVTRGLADGAVQLEVRAWLAQSDFLPGRTAIVEAAHAALEGHGLHLAPPQVQVVQRASPTLGADDPSSG